jgi:hypothetical protein
MFRSFRNRFRANSSTSEEEAQPVHEDAVVEVEEDERGSDAASSAGRVFFAWMPEHTSD